MSKTRYIHTLVTGTSARSSVIHDRGHVTGTVEPSASE